MTTIFEKRQGFGYWAQVGDNGRFFETADHGDNWETTHNAAQRWFVDECNSQDPAQSMTIVGASWARLFLLVHRVADVFPLPGSDYKFMLDDHRSALVVAFGSILVTESMQGYNIEMVNNWLTNSTVTVCTGVSIEVAAAIVRNSESSRNFRDIEPRSLHLSDLNREILFGLCGVK